MSILPQGTSNKELENTISLFFSRFKVVSLLYKCNAGKEKGVPAGQLFMYKFCNGFENMSMYMQMRTGKFNHDFSKNTIYRFLNSTKTNWLRFTTVLSKKIVDFMSSLTDEGRINAFIIDDSLFERTSCKKTELGARVFDHCSMKFKLGYRLMTLGWTDGNSFVPINSCLLSSNNNSNVIGPEKNFDNRTIAGQRRNLAKKKGTDAMLELIKKAQSCGHKADYVLFDTWFSNPAQLLAIKQMGLDAIAMIKKSSRIHYTYEGKKLSINKIFDICKKRRGRSKYLLSVDVIIGDENPTPAKIVCVRNRNNKKDWIAFICTNTELSEEEIIRIYGKRWQIEVFFKTCKSMLNLVGECHCLSYDALTIVGQL